MKKELADRIYAESKYRVLDVAKHYLGEPAKKTHDSYLFHCFGAAHKESDRTPSLSVRVTPAEKRCWSCWVCDVLGADGVELVKRYDGLDDEQALLKTAKILGVSVDDSGAQEVKLQTIKTEQRPAPKIAEPTEISYMTDADILRIYPDRDYPYYNDRLARYFWGAVRTTPDLAELWERYRVGSDRSGRTLFFYTDIDGHTRGCKVVTYLDNGHRDKTRLPYWKKPENFQMCLFGEHLLRDRPDATVAIVESEKTALLCSYHLRDMVWLACGGLGFLSEKTCMVLKGRNVVLYPDDGAEEQWEKKLPMLRKVGCRTATLSRWLDDFPDYRGTKKDIADVLLDDAIVFRTLPAVPREPKTATAQEPTTRKIFPLIRQPEDNGKIRRPYNDGVICFESFEQEYNYIHNIL